MKPDEERKPESTESRHYLNTDERAKVRHLMLSGVSTLAISERLGISRNRITDLMRKDSITEGK
jgi:IS30 family transposase